MGILIPDSVNLGCPSCGMGDIGKFKIKARIKAPKAIRRVARVATGGAALTVLPASAVAAEVLASRGRLRWKKPYVRPPGIPLLGPAAGAAASCSARYPCSQADCPSGMVFRPAIHGRSRSDLYRKARCIRATLTRLSDVGCPMCGISGFDASFFAKAGEAFKKAAKKGSAQLKSQLKAAVQSRLAPQGAAEQSSGPMGPPPPPVDEPWYKTTGGMIGIGVGAVALIGLGALALRSK